MLPSLSALSLAEEPTGVAPYDRIQALVVGLANPAKRPKELANGDNSLPDWWRNPLSEMNNTQLIQLYEAQKAHNLKVAGKRGSDALIKESDLWNQNQRVLIRALAEKAAEMRRKAAAAKESELSKIMLGESPSPHSRMRWV